MERVPGSHFEIRVVLLVLRLFFEGALSLRAASRACGIFDHHNGQSGLDAPSHTTIANFVQRLGLYQIQRLDQKRTDWIWLFDHTIGAGTTKCLIVVGISLEMFQQLQRPLRHDDLTTIGLIPVEVSNGAVVCDQLNQLSEQFGAPVAMLSDRGSDLKKGVELYAQQCSSPVRRFYDIVHLACCVIKAILNADSLWESHRQACCKCANRLRQSSLAHLKPPTPRTKARYMNYDPEVRWSARALYMLDRVRSGNLKPRQRERLPLEKIEDYLGWLDDYRGRIEVWRELMETGQRIVEGVRRNGYCSQTSEAIGEMNASLQHDESKQLLDTVKTQVDAMCEGMLPHERYPGSSEVLESLIGRGKRMLHHRGNSLTSHVLSMAASTVKLTTETIHEALSWCRIKHLTNWAKKNLMSGVHTKRREDLAQTEEERLRKDKGTAIPSF